MDSWGWALLLKPILGLAMLAFVFGTAWILARLLRPIFPNGKLKDLLFDDGRQSSAAESACPGQDRLDCPAIIHWKP